MPAPIALLALVVLFAGAAHGKVAESEAARLGDDLTPLGAIRAGNADGSIPPWDGGITVPPPDYRPGDHHPDPFADDPVLFTITAENLDRFRDKLSPGQVAMFERYPETWRMPVYPTRRSASYPARIYDAAQSNARAAELTPDGNGVVGSTAAYPFPVPNNGLEAIWNHLMRYRSEGVRRFIAQAVPTEAGAYNEVIIEEQALYPYVMNGADKRAADNRLAYFLQEVTAPARLAGTLLLVHEPLNQRAENRQAWTYNPGQRRVRRAPNIAYDNPGTASDGQRTSDQFDTFNGAPDRYDWTLVGRREMFVPYNSYRLHSDQVTHADLLQPHHIAPQFLRYELHRVWQVEARLKDGTSHIYARRTFFLDEDSWQILVADHYDRRGELWRLAETYTINYYEVPMIWETLLAIYDLENGRYLAFGLNNELPVDDFSLSLDQGDFTPAALRRRGRR